MTERKIKSYGLFGTLQFIESAYTDDVKRQIMDRVPQEVRDFASQSASAAWAPPEYSCHLWRQIAAAAKDEQEGFDKLVECGACMGEFATNTYLRLLLKVVNMKIMATKIPALWSKDANFGKVTADLSSLGEGKATFHYDEMDDYPYFGPICKGWFSYSMKAMGMKDFHVSVVDWSMADPDPGKLTFEMSWTP